MNKLKWIILSVFFLMASCKSYLVKESSKPQLVKNLDSKTPVIFPCANNSSQIFWVGDYMTLTDTMTSINAVTLREDWLGLRKTLRFGKWLLKDDFGNIYAEAFYKNDTLISMKKYIEYPENCIMDSMKCFSNRDTAFIMIFY